MGDQVCNIQVRPTIYACRTSLSVHQMERKPFAGQMRQQEYYHFSWQASSLLSLASLLCFYILYGVDTFLSAVFYQGHSDIPGNITLVFFGLMEAQVKVFIKYFSIKLLMNSFVW